MAKLTVVLIIIVIALGSCKKSNETINGPVNDTTVTPLSVINFIADSSFESGSNFTLGKWRKEGSDTTYINSSIDVPPGGGTFSVRVKGTGMPLLLSGYISYELSPPVGTHRYRLSVWGKGYGTVSLHLIPGSTGADLRKTLWFYESTWVERSVLDTLTMTSSDLVEISLGPNFIMARNGWDIMFDLCRLEQLE